MKDITKAVLGLVGVLMMVAVAVINSYVAFFVHSDYTGGMFAASAFWVLIGWIFFHAAISRHQAGHEA